MIKNKQYIIVLFLFFPVINSVGQIPLREPATVSEKIPVYFGINNTMSIVYDVIGYFWGIEIGTSYPENSNHALLVKLAGTWIDNNIDVIVAKDTQSLATTFPLQMRYGGLKLGYTPFAYSTIQPSFDLFMAGGDVSLSVTKSYLSANKALIEKRYQPVIVIEPQLNLEILLVDYLKVGLGISYRNVFNVQVPWIDRKDVSNFGFHAMVEIGKFNN